MKRWAYVVAFILSMASMLVHAQKPDLRFDRITDESGRSLGFITGLTQDTTGFMWISSRQGLYRYDGYNYLEFRTRPNDSTSIPFNDITNLYYDRDGVLWLKHYDQYVAFSGNQIDTNYQPITEKRYDFAAEIVQDPDGGRWIGPSAEGLYYFPAKQAEGRLFKEAKPMYKQAAYRFLDSLQANGQQLASFSRMGNDEDTTVAFSLKKTAHCLVGAAGETDQYGRYDYAWLTDKDGNLIWEMTYAGSKYAGGAPKNRLQMAALKLEPGTYKLHYRSDNSHSWGNWNDPKPDKVSFYGATVVHITPEQYQKANNQLIKSYIPGNTISRKDFSDLYTGRNGKVHIVSRAGLDIYQKANNQFVRMPIDYKSLLNYSSPGALRIHCLYQTRDRLLWIGTSHGLIRFNKDTGTAKVFRNTRAQPNLLTNNTVYAVMEDRKGRLWIGTDDGLNLMNRQSGDIYHYYSNVKNRLFDNRIIDFYEDHSGNIWLATPEGLNHLKPRRFYFVSLDSEGYTSFPMHVDADENAIWYRGNQDTLFKYNRTKNKYSKYLLDDSFFPTDEFTGDRLYNFNNIKTGKNGDVWITIEEKLLRFDTRKNQGVLAAKAPPVMLDNDTVDNRFSLIKNDGAYLWLFALDGVYKYRKSTSRLVADYPFERSYGEEIYNIDDFVKDAKMHPSGNIWIRTVEGIFRFKPVSGKMEMVHRFSEEVRFSSATNGNIYLDPEGRVWVAFLPAIYMFNPSSGEENIVMHNDIGDVGRCNIVADKDSILWVYTNNGLFRYNPRKEGIQQFTNRNKLADNDINGLVDDGQGNLWITSSKGLTRYDKDRRDFEVVSQEFVSQNFVGISRANLKKRGELLFFTPSGYYSYFPDSINTREPHVVITSFKLFGEEVHFDSLTHLKHKIVLDYDQNFFTFEFSALDFTNPTQNKYRYMLEGLDKAWTRVGANNRRAPYTAVPHGSYVFRLKGSNNDGVWAGEERQIKIVIIPPLWQRPWAYVLYVVFITLSVFLYIRWRERNLKREKRILERKVAERTEEIERQKEELAKQRDIATQQRDQIAEQKQSITDSIMYARRIQNAVLPPEDFIGDILPKHFILNRPRDIVSGDYYWMTQRGNKTYIVAADCTGHGVPGAFMSMLGVAFLNEIVNRSDIVHANDVLNELRAYVIKSLHQTGREDEAKDGMDISMCILNNETMKMEYAGAFNPLYLIRNGELIKIKADRMPIGIYFKKNREFTNHAVDIKPNDTFYIFSDGYVDQFGGQEGRKFMAKSFQRLLLSIQHHSLDEQKQILEQKLDEWMNGYEQVDDILVVGVRI